LTTENVASRARRRTDRRARAAPADGQAINHNRRIWFLSHS
jgi:hypothetical protein